MVLWLTELIFSLEIDPELEAKRRLCEASRHLSMDNTSTSSHPLQISRPDHSRVAFKVFVSNLSREHVGDGLKSPVGVIGEPSRELDIEQVHHQERVQLGQMLATNNPLDFGTLAFTLFFRFEHHLYLLELREF